VKFCFINVHRRTLSVTALCRELGVSRSGFYAWQQRPLPRREDRNEALLKEIKNVHSHSHGRYGSPRVHKSLLRRGVSCGRNRVARLMQLNSIVACCQRKFRNLSTCPGELDVAPDLLRRDFTASAPNQVWVSDMTFLSTRQGWVHLCVVLDLYSRRCVGWSLGSRPSYELAQQALRSAIEQRRPEPGLIFHSDQGGAYRSFAIQQLFDDHGIMMSTSRPYNCLDNAVAESFFKTLKLEM
jgi:transposase InsO family protein